MDDVTKEAEEDFDTVANEVVVGGAVDLLLGERVFPGGIAIEDVSFLARVFTGEDFGDGLAHDTLGIRGATRGEIHGEFLRRGISASCWFNLHKERKNICTEDLFAFGEAVTEVAKGLLGLIVLTKVFDTELLFKLDETGIADEHPCINVRAGKEGVEVVMVAGNETADGIFKCCRGVITGLADAFIEGLQFLGGKAAKVLAHETDAAVAEELSPAEGQEGVAGFERSLDAINGTAGGKAVVEAGLDLPGEKAAEVSLGDVGPRAEGIWFTHGVGHKDVDDLLGEAGEFADMGAEDGLDLAHGVQAVEGKVEGLVVLQCRAGGVAIGDDIEDGLGHGGGAKLGHGVFGGLDSFGVFIFLAATGATPEAVAIIAAIVGIPEKNGPKLRGGQNTFAAQGLSGQTPGFGVRVLKAGDGGGEHALGQQILLHAQDTRPRGADVTALTAIAAPLGGQAFVRLKNDSAASLHNGLTPILFGNRPPNGGVAQIQRHIDFSVENASVFAQVLRRRIKPLWWLSF